MITINKVFILFILLVCYGAPTTSQQCPLDDTIHFTTKIEKSSIVVYGKPMAKIVNLENRALFHVFFQVDCILKGPEMLRQINITNSDRANGKEICQNFLSGHGYSIVFLEPISLDVKDYKTFTPANFTEVPIDEVSADQLLASTCNLVPKVPLQSSASVSDLCPAVGTDPLCQESNVEISTTITDGTNNRIIDYSSKEDTTETNEILFIENGNQILLKPINDAEQQEINIIRSNSILKQIDVDLQNSSQTIKYSIFLLITMIFSCFNSV